MTSLDPPEPAEAPDGAPGPGVAVSPDELDRRIADAVRAQRLAAEADPVADTSMFLSHHWPSQYDRCAQVGRFHVCRRCLVLYPVAVLVCLLAALRLTWPDRLDPWFLWLLPIAGVVEFSLDALGVIRHNATRQVVVSALLAVAYGKLLWRYANHPADGLAWTVVIVDTGICLVAALIGRVLRGTDNGTVTPRE